MVHLNPDHQNLIDRIMGLHEKGWIPKKISEHLNDLGVSSWSGKQFYPELVFGIVRKARLRAARDRELTSQESLGVELRRSSALRNTEVRSNTISPFQPTQHPLSHQ